MLTSLGNSLPPSQLVKLRMWQTRARTPQPSPWEGLAAKKGASPGRRVFPPVSARRLLKPQQPRDGINLRNSESCWGQMTAEVAVLNKLGVALAADSTVSIGDKTYDSANKLFALSKHHPVGILVYNTMEMTTVPMEILIKSYRERLKSKSHKRLEDYSLEFQKHISERTPFDKDEEKDNVLGIVRNFCRKLHTFTTDKCDESGLDLEAIGDGADIKKILNEELDRLDAGATKTGRFCVTPLQRASESRSLTAIRR